MAADDNTTSLVKLIAQPEPEVPAMSIAGNTIYLILDKEVACRFG
jgi:hypothetical protein